jgi:ubiquitin-conjugating enzyme E2 A
MQNASPPKEDGAAASAANRANAQKRLMTDLRAVHKDDAVTAGPVDDNIFEWSAVLTGPVETMWEGGIFQLSLSFSEEYPNQPPRVKFLTKVLHPNIYVDGNICLDILRAQWSPGYDVRALLVSIQSLLCDPNPASPANLEAAELLNDNRAEYERRVRKLVEESLEALGGSDLDDDDDDDE